MATISSIRKQTKAGLAGFIDLLGFSQRVRSVNTFKELLEVREQIAIAQDHFDIGKTDELYKEYLNVTGQIDFVLSDSIFTFIPLQSEVISYSDELDTVMADLEKIALSQASCVLNGVFIRGGISLGWFYSDRKNFISDALVDAVNLEKEICYPVIAVSKSIMNKYRNSPQRKYYSESADPFNNDFFLNLTISGKSISYINYLKLAVEAVSPVFTKEERQKRRKMSPEKSQKYENQKYWEAQTEFLLQHKKAIESGAHLALGNRRARSKYRWLARYHNSIALPFQKIDPKVVIGRKLTGSNYLLTQ